MLDELLNAPETTQGVVEEIKINSDGTSEVVGEGGHIHLISIESVSTTTSNTVALDEEFEKELVADLKAFEELKARIEAKKAEIKEFLDKTTKKSFATDLIKVKYVSATTQTSIDSTRLKAEMPEIAAKYSKTVAKSSSVSISVE